MRNILILSLVILADQSSKYWAAEHGMITINSGIAFGWSLAMNAGWMVVSGQIALLIILGWLWPQKHRSLFWLLAGGAVSNLLDRFVWGGVRDWLQLPVESLTNNLADWAIFMSLAVLIILELKKYADSYHF